MTNTKQSTVWLGMSFFIIICLLAAVSYYSMSNFTLINKHLNSISGEYQTKIFLTSTMRHAARERTVNLLHMIILDDPFEQDNEWLQFNINGSDFAEARLALLSMSFDNVEQSLLNRQRRITQMNADQQLQVAELALGGQKEEAIKLLRSKTIPLQNEVFKILNDLYFHYENTLKLKKIEAERSYRKINIISWTTGIIAILIGTLISALTVRSISRTRLKLIQNQQQLQQNQLQLEMALEATNDGLWDWDIKNNSIYYSPQWKHMLGYRDNDIGSDFFFWEQLIHPDDKQRIKQSLQDNLDNKLKYCTDEYRIRKANGEWLWIMDRGKVTERDKEGLALRAVGIHTDISQRKQMEKQLEDRQQFFRGVLNDMQTAVAVLDKTGRVTFINDSPLKNIGLNAEIMGQQFSDCSLWSTNNDIKALVTKRIIDASMGKSSIEDIQIKTVKGTLWITLSIHPVMNKLGEVEHLVPEVRDITDRVYAEEALRRSQKMEAIGQLSGGIAHDFNNQLGIVIGYLDMLADYQNNSVETIQKWLDSANRATMRCVDLTRQLLTFSKQQTTEKSISNINNYIDEMNTIIGRSLTPEVAIQYSLAEDLWNTLINPGEFQDALLNLIINARDAMPDGGHLFIQTSNTHLDKDHSSYEPYIKVGDYIQLIVSDTGTGISKENLERIFEPFFSTKLPGKGTGLGLAMIYAFVKRNNGYVNVKSEENKGTTFCIYLPRISEYKEVVQNIESADTALPGGNETILIVDDEPDLTELANTFLISLGYRTLKAVDTEVAIQILETHKNIDLLFSDVVMPGDYNGYQLADLALQLQPQIKILLTSGYTSKAKSSPDTEKFRQNLLKKPYSKSALADTIRKTLDS